MLEGSVSEEKIIIPGVWHLEFAHSAGKAASRFLIALRDRQVLLASPCRECKRLYVPPRSFCEDCFVPTEEEWVEVGPAGTIEAFTVTYASFPGYPAPPYALAYVRPDGAGTAMVNFVTGLDSLDPKVVVQRLAIGARVEAAFVADRQGRVTDFSWQLTLDTVVANAK